MYWGHKHDSIITLEKMLDSLRFFFKINVTSIVKEGRKIRKEVEKEKKLRRRKTEKRDKKKENSRK